MTNMSKVNKLMAKRAVKKLDQQIGECLENINNWYSNILNLIMVKRSTLNKRCDKQLYKESINFIETYFGEEDSSDSDSKSDNSESDSDSESLTSYVPKSKAKPKKSKKPKHHSDTESEIELEDEPMTKESMQKSALELLTNQETEAEVLNKHITECRKKMYTTPEAPICKPVNFTLTTDPLTQQVTSVPIDTSNLDVVGEDEEELLCEEILDDGTTRIISGNPTDVLPPVSQSTTVPNVTFRSATLDPPEVSALTKISCSQRDDLIQKLYLQAKENVESQTADLNMDQEKKDEIIRRETTRLLNVYKETH
jgi:hypothetical protein